MKVTVQSTFYVRDNAITSYETFILPMDIEAHLNKKLKFLLDQKSKYKLTLTVEN